MASKFQKEFGVRISPMKFYQSSEIDIANFRRKMILDKKLSKAAVKLQSWWRKVMPSRKPWYSVK